MSILAIDAGTTGVTALIVSDQGEIIARGYQEFPQYFPHPGWVEHEPEEIWQAALTACKLAIGDADSEISCIGITNQRETAVIWDRNDLSSPTKAIVWQDRRTSIYKDELDQKNTDDWIRTKTGLNIDPYFTASKFLWWARNETEIWQGVVDGKYALGTIDSYLIARLTGGAAHLTDASNASRTQLMDLEIGHWDRSLLDAFEIPGSALPKITSSWGEIATTNPAHFLGVTAPITGVAGDQQAALFGQLAFKEGESKATYGTGAFILTNTGSRIVSSQHGLLGTVAWKSPDGKITYALEGSVFVAGASVQWLRDGLKIIEKAADVEALAASVADSDGVVFMPALTGLGAPYWQPDIRGSIFGITRGTTDAHIAYATLEAIAIQVKAVLDAMELDMQTSIPALSVDGGAAANNLLMQIQADLISKDVERATNLESTGLGAALLAGLGSGIWTSLSDLDALNPTEQTFSQKSDRSKVYARWQQALRATEWFHKN
ncbi:MAG: glycerol kinase GlpK [Micrococcales bacterium]|nr:glycerol kinase GlpK [Micrococcales bacterium]